VELSEAFGADFERLLARFAHERGLLPDQESLGSVRFLARSVVPHLSKLSRTFNREPGEPEPGAEPRARRTKEERAAQHAKGLDPYWKTSSNPTHLRLAYFLAYMPCNLYRVAAVWSELARLGFRWKAGERLRAIEFGAGPATGACGVAAGERFAPIGAPATGDWALIEQEKALLELGREWAAEYFPSIGAPDWGTRPFQRRVDPARGWLPPAAPKFNLWLTSFFLNELTLPPKELARSLIDSWEKHLEEEGLVILVEPALKAQSRRLLELRRELLAAAPAWLRVLAPCLGHQACGALASPEDWCHEEAMWWRPPYIRVLDKLAGLDRKTLPFSYLVLTRSRRSHEELLPALAGEGGARERLVSPAHAEGRDEEFFICGEAGKRRARLRGEGLERGDILLGAEARGDANSTRIESVKKRV
jgi:hypothetical protein